MNIRRFSLALAVIVAACAVPELAVAASPPREVAVVTQPVTPLAAVNVSSALDSMRFGLRNADSCVVRSASVRTIKAAAFGTHRDSAVTRPTSTRVPLSLLGPLAFLGFVGSIKTTAADKDSKFTTDTVRAQLNKLIASFNYFLNNGVFSSTVATQPVVATATVTSKVKTTNATVLKESGIAVALAGSDNFWTLTGANLAAGFFRRYLLLDTAGVASVLASSDAATKAGCLWPSIPADGTAIVGILTIQNVTNPFIPGTTLLGAAGVTATYQDGIDDSVFLHAQVTP